MDFVTADVRGRGRGGALVKGAGGSGSSSHGGGGTSSLAAADVVPKRRKLDISTRTDLESSSASADSACVVQCERCEAAEDGFGGMGAAEMGDERWSSVDAEDPGSTSCCSSNESAEVAVEKTIESVDLEGKGKEVDTKSERQPNGKAEGCGGSDAQERNPRRRQTPTQAEIDKFFSAAETRTVLLFKEKYNFDFEKGKPLKGRYEWCKGDDGSRMLDGG